MGSVLIAVGLSLCIAGLIVHAIDLLICTRIVRATKDKEDALTIRDSWLNIRQGVKLRKLSKIANSDEDERLRKDATIVLRLTVLTYALFVPGWLLVLAGASSRSQ